MWPSDGRKQMMRKADALIEEARQKLGNGPEFIGWALDLQLRLRQAAGKAYAETVLSDAHEETNHLPSNREM
ncbi:hypothetical protein Tter_0510 [Thermobaculum terrenum ATCC BAA-798]|uniref:Uncharacterized protein n=1 Tax=Thermobaculum terrenum (strain ATCC BAA-798 / CCMEE 7001 / YNP1) TaxID=525904 RepID=D1CES5_THET1|nr:hypothetical protein [Thermobaculum terrenum]ACZ41431.1 hypothetical protein Tter_0510 [Thermobaculum terrenum ATCC BAA-798]